MKVDINKTYRTKDGHPVVIYAVYEGQAHGVHGAYQREGGEWWSATWKVDGWLCSPDYPSRLDLVEVRSERVVWINEYPAGKGYVWATKKEADRGARGARIALHRVVLNEDTMWQADAEREGDDE